MFLGSLLFFNSFLCREASITRIDDTFKIIANHVFFRDVWANRELDDDVKFVMNQLRELSLENEKTQ